MRGRGPHKPLPSVPAGPLQTLPQRLHEMGSAGIEGSFLAEEAAIRIEQLETAMSQISAQECECSENHDYNPACPHTLASLALFDPNDQATP